MKWVCFLESRNESGFYGSANKSFEGINDKRELMQVALECPHGRIRVQAVARLGDGRGAPCGTHGYNNKKSIKTNAYKSQPRSSRRKLWTDFARRVLARGRTGVFQAGMPAVWIGRKYPLSSKNGLMIRSLHHTPVKKLLPV